MKPNYGFAKRQRELAKKQKKEEKKLRKLAEDAQADAGTAEVQDAEKSAEPGSPQQGG